MHSTYLECPVCGNKGRIELLFLTHPRLTPSGSFEYLGNSLSDNYMHLLCSSCKSVLLVDPTELVNVSTTKVISGIIGKQDSLLAGGKAALPDSGNV